MKLATEKTLTFCQPPKINNLKITFINSWSIIRFSSLFHSHPHYVFCQTSPHHDTGYANYNQNHVSRSETNQNTHCSGTNAHDLRPTGNNSSFHSVFRTEFSFLLQRDKRYFSSGPKRYGDRGREFFQAVRSGMGS